MINISCSVFAHESLLYPWGGRWRLKIVQVHDAIFRWFTECKMLFLWQNQFGHLWFIKRDRFACKSSALLTGNRRFICRRWICVVCFPISCDCIVKSNVEQHIDSGSAIRCLFYVRCVPIVSSAPKLWLSDSSKAPKMKSFSTFLWLCRSQPFDVGSVLVEAILPMLIGRTKSLFLKRQTKRFVIKIVSLH